MTAPALSPVAQVVYDMLSPYALEEETTDYSLAWFLRANGLLLQDVETIVQPEDGSGPYELIMDIDDIPDDALGWLAQYVGVTLDVGLTAEQKRERIRSTDGFQRGTPAAIRGAALATLTGDKTVIFRERFGGAYKLEVVTYTDQTPDPAATEAAVRAQKPGGITLTFNVHDGQDFESIFENYATLGDLYAAYATLQGVVTDQPGT